MSSPSSALPLDTTGPSGESEAGRLSDRDLPPLVRPPARGGGDGALPRRPVRDRAAHRRRLLLRLPRQPAVHARGSRRHREEDGAHRQAEPADREEARPEGRGARALREEGPDPQVRAHQGEVGRPRAVLHDGGVRRLLPRAAPRLDEGHQGLQAEAGADRRLLEGQGGQPVDAAHLRVRLLHEGGAGPAPLPDRGGEAARPPQARPRARPLLDRRRDGGRPRAVAPEGRIHPQADRGLLARRAPDRAATTSSTRPTSRVSTSGRRAGTPSTTRRTCTRRSRSRTSSTS